MITVYTKPDCGACIATEVWLNRKGIDYIQADIETTPGAREVVDRLGYTQMPVVVAGPEHWSGFRENKLKSLLAT